MHSSLRPLRTSACSALKIPLSAENAEVRREPQRQTMAPEWTFLCKAISKQQSQTKLNLPRVGSRRQTRDAPDVVGKRRRIRVQRQVRIRGSVPVLNIEDVEHFHPELQLPVFSNRKALEQRQVGIEHRFAAKHVATETSKRA